MRIFVSILLLTLATCQAVLGWTFHYPLSAKEGQKQLLFTITTDDTSGQDAPYVFQVWKNITDKPSEQIEIRVINTDTNTTQFYWDNTQPVDTIILFQLTDKSNRPVRSPWVRVTADLFASASVISSMSTASVASVSATQTGSNTMTTPSASASETGVSTPTPSPVKTNIGAIAGGVVGGVLFLAAIIAAVLFFLCRRRRRSEQAPASETLDLNTGGTNVTPFVYDNPYHAQSPNQPRYDPAPQLGGPYHGASDAPPIYSPPPTSPSAATSYPESSSYTYTSQASGSTYHIASGPRLFDQKGRYAPVSSTPH